MCFSVSTLSSFTIRAHFNLLVYTNMKRIRSVKTLPTLSVPDLQYRSQWFVKQLASAETTDAHQSYPQCILSFTLFLTSVFLATRLATMSWIIPRLLPSVDMDLRSVSMASWLVLPSSDSPLTAISWSFTRSRPSYCRTTMMASSHGEGLYLQNTWSETLGRT